MGTQSTEVNKQTQETNKSANESTNCTNDQTKITDTVPPNQQYKPTSKMSSKTRLKTTNANKECSCRIKSTKISTSTTLAEILPKISQTIVKIPAHPRTSTIPPKSLTIAPSSQQVNKSGNSSAVIRQ